jgi:hypothetical protein
MVLQYREEILKSRSDTLEEKVRNFISSEEMKQSTELCSIMSSLGSDKSSDWHNYTPVYHFLFSDSRDSTKTFFELGIWQGCSVRGWSKYFSSAEIFAGDVDPKFLVNESNIRSYICDQDSSESIKIMWSQIDRQFDIIIEDGKHEFESNLNFLLGSIHMLKSGGIFIIEDLTDSTKFKFNNVLTQLKQNLNLNEIFILDIYNPKNNIDNCLLIIKK